MHIIFVIFQQDEGCGEPPVIPNANRFGSVTEVTYECDECYTGGGSATCRNGEWSHTGRCDSKLMNFATPSHNSAQLTFLFSFKI